MADVISLEEQFAILSGSDRAGMPQRVLKHGDTFGVFDLHGDVNATLVSDQGLYHAGTRFLSRFELLLGPRRPLLLSSTISDDNTTLAVDLTNPDITRDGHVIVPRGSLHIFRSRLLWQGHSVEKIRVSNHALDPIQLPLVLQFDADFSDLFEVRGVRRERRGTRGGDRCTVDGAVLRYEGLDGIERRTVVCWSRPASRADLGSVAFSMTLAPQQVTELELCVDCEVAEQTRRADYAETCARAKRRVASREAVECEVRSSSQIFDRWFGRSAADLRMMLTDTGSGTYPYAGIPWFSTPFGRDGIITAMETLWAVPDVSRGVLSFLAETQATELDPERDAEPGKIVHELREGEMATLGEIPFGRYYGTADATPLFVMLADAYFERTADAEFIDRLWPHLLAALEWMSRYGDADGDGFIEYSRRSHTGLVQQGWKDSFDSIFHADGRLADPPIAVSEIQGYAYGAWKGAARLARARGDEEKAREFGERAQRLRSRFDQLFWCDDLGTFALALDGEKRPCCVRASNAGHCLFAGLVAPERAGHVADVLMSERMFSGWGVRTVAAGEARYNPMSYHNGSVWPHDNALIAAGFGRYGFTARAAELMSAMLDLSQSVDAHRLPELICGFHRRGGESPTLYPVACAPQSWAAGSVYMMLDACLGLQIDAAAHYVTFRRAVLPAGIDWIDLTNLRIGDGRLDLRLTRHRHDVGIEVLRRDGNIEIVGIK
jgi:glycogen debranching enzyme